MVFYCLPAFFLHRDRQMIHAMMRQQKLLVLFAINFANGMKKPGWSTKTFWLVLLTELEKSEKLKLHDGATLRLPYFQFYSNYIILQLIKFMKFI